MRQSGNRDRPVRSDKSLAHIAGLPAVAALFAAAPERVERLFFDARAKPSVGAFCAELARARKPYRQVDADELARLVGTAMHGGIVALARPQPVHVFDVAKARAWAGEGRALLLLDGVGNPHNLGAIARTAAFFGLPRMVLSDHPAQALPSDASYRVAEGGLERIALYRAVRFAAVLKRLRETHRVIAAAPGRHRAVSALRRGDKPFALILGNEEKGLPRATLAACDEIIAIPGAGQVQSLNVAATAAILIYAVSLSPSG
jgi:RNA methyltransferase, TrmH family